MTTDAHFIGGPYNGTMRDTDGRREILVALETTEPFKTTALMGSEVAVYKLEQIQGGAGISKTLHLVYVYEGTQSEQRKALKQVRKDRQARALAAAKGALYDVSPNGYERHQRALNEIATLIDLYGEI